MIDNDPELTSFNKIYFYLIYIKVISVVHLSKNQACYLSRDLYDNYSGRKTGSISLRKDPHKSPNL
jgi:hypothetical protein